MAKVATALRQPIRYAGVGEHTVFALPRPARDLDGVATVPGTAAGDACVVVAPDLWMAFRDVSLWVEALCIHEWSPFTERIAGGFSRGAAYALLTERPDNRLPVDGERNRIDQLLDEGERLVCPWTGRRPIVRS